MENKYNAETHEEWVEAMKRIAGSWHRKHNFIDEEEAFSELLVCYAEALGKKYDNVQFNTIFTWYKKKALQNLLRDANGGSGERREKMGTLDCVSVTDDILDLNEYGRDVLAEIDMRLGEETLSTDVRFILQHLREHGLEGNTTARVGANTVVKDIVSTYGWPLRRAREAVNGLKEYYKECIA